MQCALIGYGYWGKILEKYISAHGELQLKYIVTSSKGELTLEEVLGDPDLSAVFICTPIDTHYEIARAALLSGKHVFCEKPLTKKLDETAELQQIAAEKELVLMTDYIYRFSESLSKMKSLLGEIGPIRFVRASIQQFGNFYAHDDVVDVLGVHMLSALHHILELEDSNLIFDREGFYINAEAGLIYDCAVGFLLGSGVRGQLRCGCLSSRKERTLEVSGEKGHISFDMLSSETLRAVFFEKGASGMEKIKEESYGLDEGNNLTKAVGTFVDWMKTGSTNPYREQDMKIAKSLEDLKAVLRSAS